VLTRLRHRAAILALSLVVVDSLAHSAFAITADVAKKCEALTAKTYPPRQAGNPAAGSDKGTAKQERDYFNNCVANGGNIDDQSPQNSK
jgi:hypothetical protein